MLFNVEFLDGSHYSVDVADIKSTHCDVLNKKNVATFTKINYENFEQQGLYAEIWESICSPTFGNVKAKTSTIKIREGEQSPVIEPISHPITRICILDKKDIDKILEIEEDGKLIITRFYLENGDTKLINLRVSLQKCKQIIGENVAPSLYETIYNLTTFYKQKYGINNEEIAGSINIDVSVLDTIISLYEPIDKPIIEQSDTVEIIDEDNEEDDFLEGYNDFSYL